MRYIKFKHKVFFASVFMVGLLFLPTPPATARFEAISRGIEKEQKAMRSAIGSAISGGMSVSVSDQGVLQAVKGGDTSIKDQVDLNNETKIARDREEDMVAQYQKEFEDALYSTASNTMRVFLTQMAKKAADYATAGATGQKPAMETEGWADALSNAGDAALGDAIASFGEALVGKNICGGPWAINLLAGLDAAQSSANPVKPQCTFSKLQESWDPTDPAILNKIQLGYVPGSGEENDLFKTIDATFAFMSAQSSAEEEKRLEKKDTSIMGQFKNSVDEISGAITAPGSLIAHGMEWDLVDSPKTALRLVGHPAADALNVFMGTFIQKVQSFYLKKGLVDLSKLAKKKSKVSGNINRVIRSLQKSQGSGHGASVGAGVGGDLFAGSINQNDYMAPPPSYDHIAELMVCPDDIRLAGINNCAMPQGFGQAIQADNGEHLTLREAIGKKILNPLWDFGYKDPGNRIEPSINEGIPFSGIVKMRRARLVPIGWEIAARELRKRAEPKTLGDLVAEFDDRGDDGICGTNDAGESPYCNLVDPEWILKAPAYVCRAVRNGQIFTSGGGKRGDYCADLQDCVAEEDNGKCDAFGYCKKEKNVWRLGGNRCDKKYESCWGFNRLNDSQAFYYLKNTLDFSSCNQENMGCLWYSKVKKDRRVAIKGTNQTELISSWVTPKENSEDVMYFNHNIDSESCSEAAVGCTRFIRFSYLKDVADINSALTDVLVQGDYLSYQEQDQVQDVYLKVDPTLAKEDNPLFCQEQYVGCEYYTPINGDPAVTAIVSDLDRCPKVCVGYDSYIQEKTYFEDQKTGVDFIPKTAVSCNAANVGCEQFTNLDLPERGGENIENYNQLRQCIPFNNQAKTYFFWEGTDTGYQLNRLSLKKGVTLSYSYKDKTGNIIQVNESGEPPAYILGFDSNADYASCNKEIFKEKLNPDCFELFDESGQMWYRRISLTISAPNPAFYENGNIPFAESCHNYRKTLSGEMVCRGTGICDQAGGCDCAIPGQFNCLIKQGQDSCSNDNSCINTGGAWRGGECVYQAIPAESIPCSAVGCKQYRGTAARNEKNVIFDTFEAGSLDMRWFEPSLDNGPLVKSPVSLQFGGSSMRYKQVAAYDLTESCQLPLSCQNRDGCRCVTDGGNSCLVGRGETGCIAPLVSPQGTFVVDFFARNSTTLPTITLVSFQTASENPNDLMPRQIDYIGAVQSVSSQWNKSVVGPAILKNGIPQLNRLKTEALTFEVWSANPDKQAELSLPENQIDLASASYEQLGQYLRDFYLKADTFSYIDNVILRQEKDSFYLVENSWVTPAECETDPPLSGGTAISSMLGCKEYTDRFGGTEYLKSVRSLCPSEMVGCEALVDTHNSTSPLQEIFNSSDPLSRVVVPADNVEYVINDPANYCSSTAQGCKEFAMPHLNGNQEIYTCSLSEICDADAGCVCTRFGISDVECLVGKGKYSCQDWEVKYLLDNPDNYNKVLCQSNELFCQGFADENKMYYFKDPLERYCQYRTVPNTLPVEYAWYRADDSQSLNPNPPECVCEYKPIFTESERICRLNSVCEANSCSCVINNNLYAAANNLMKCDVSQGESSCVVGHNPYAWYEKGSGVINPIKCRALDPERDLAWANTCVESQSRCTAFNETSECAYRKGVCFMPAVEQGGDFSPQTCAPGAAGWDASWDWPDDDVKSCSLLGVCTNDAGCICNNTDGTCTVAKGVQTCNIGFTSGGCYCSNGQTDCYVRNGEISCNSEPGWYVLRNDQRDIYADNVQKTPLGYYNGDVFVDTKHNIDKEIVRDGLSRDQWGDVFEVDKQCESYYYLNNDRLDKTSCNGVVDWLGECVLFNDTSQKGLYFSGRDFYNGIDSSVGRQNAASCNDSGDTYGFPDNPRCDSNVILKVVRDRTCDEWIQCNTSMRRWDSDLRRFRDICFGLGSCDEYDPNNPSECLSWVKPEAVSTKITTDSYKSRFKQLGSQPDKVDWYNDEYSGFSLYNMFDPVSFRQRDYAVINNEAQGGKVKDFKLTNFSKAIWKIGCFPQDCGTFDTNIGLGGVCVSQIGMDINACESWCQTDDDCVNNLDMQLFASDKPPVCIRPVVNRPGRCYVDMGINGENLVARKECRAYPEDDSPIPYNESAIEWSDYRYKADDSLVDYPDYGFEKWRNNQFDNVNIGFIDNRQVDCSYEKVVYGDSEVRYFDQSLGADNYIPAYLFKPMGDKNSPSPSDVLDRGQSTLYLGWKGFCLEHDWNIKINAEPDDRACITWWPVDHLRGELDTGEVPLRAIWQAPVGKEYYCISTSKYENKQVASPWDFSTKAVCDQDDDGADEECRKQWLADGHNFDGGTYVVHGWRVSHSNVSSCIGTDNWTGAANRYHCSVNPAIYSGTQGLGGVPYSWPDVGGLHHNEIGVLVCDEWAQIQETLSQPGKIIDSKVSTTKIRAADKVFAQYWDGYSTANGYKFNRQSYSQYASGPAAVLEMKADNYGAGCFAGKRVVDPNASEDKNGNNIIEPNEMGKETYYAGCAFDNATYLDALKVNLKNFGGADFSVANNMVVRVNGGENNPGDDHAYPLGTPVLGITGAMNDKWNYDSVKSLVGKFGGAPYGSANNLHDLFGKIYKFYDRDGNLLSDPPDDISGQSPVIKPAVFDENGRYNEVDNNGRVAINNQVSGRIDGKGFLKVNLSFYGYNENGDQLPLRYIEINWNDGSEKVVLDGFFKNRKHDCQRYCAKEIDANPDDMSTWRSCRYSYECGKDQNNPENRCVPYTFGDDPDMCMEDSDDESGAFIFTHVYNCVDNNDMNFYNDVLGCKFKPQIILKDNWGESKTAWYGAAADWINDVIVVTP